MKRSRTTDVTMVAVALAIAAVVYANMGKAADAKPEAITTALRGTLPRCRDEYVALLQRQLLDGRRLSNADLATYKEQACGPLGDQMRATRL